MTYPSAFIIVLFLAGNSFANDSTFGGAGGALAPLKETRIRMASENILIEATDDRYWSVTASYVFENTTPKNVNVQLGFPELGCLGDCDMGHPFTMNGLVTTVRGIAVNHRTGRIDPENKPVWAPRLGLIHLFDVAFNPHERVVVQHRYRHAASTSIDGHSVTYLTRTGAFWNGPIGEASFTIKHRIKHYYTKYPKDFNLVDRKEVVTKTGSQWIYRFAMKDWRPVSDLYVFFGNPLNRVAQSCPVPYDVEDAWRNALSNMPKPEPKRIEQIVLNEVFDNVGLATIKVCKNFPYAVHGRPFKDPTLSKYFYGKPTQRRCDDCDENDGMPRVTVHFFHRVNPAYSDKLLDKHDQRYVRIAELAESRLLKAKEEQAAAETKATPASIKK